MSALGFPEVPHATDGEHVGAQPNFNTMVGNHLNILVHPHLLPASSLGQG
jgi:hypothetical protein